MEKISLEIPAGRLTTRQAGAELEVAEGMVTEFTVWAILETALPQLDLDDWEEELCVEMGICFDARLDAENSNEGKPGKWRVECHFVPGKNFQTATVREILATRTI